MAKKLSFCITSFNRFEQISLTLPKNIKHNQIFNNEVEFIVVDFGSTDGTSEWIIKNFFDELTSGYLKFFKTKPIDFWHACICKNTAHLLANGKIVTNLDCDNYVGPRGSGYVLSAFEKDGDKLLLHQFSGVPFDGSYGRISTYKAHFERIGGYNESLYPVGYEDKDLLLRLVSYGLKYKHLFDKRYCQAIPNSKEEGMKYINTDISFEEMNLHNRRMAKQNITNGILIANNKISGIKNEVYRYNPNLRDWKLVTL